MNNMINVLASEVVINFTTILKAVIIAAVIPTTRPLKNNIPITTPANILIINSAIQRFPHVLLHI